MLHLLLAIIYLAFVSLGLPDSLLGAAWPSMYQSFGVPLSCSGVIFFIISLGTVISSLLSDRLTRRLGAGRVTALSTGLTALALFGFSVSGSFPALCLWAVPYGLGAGSVDAALNNYVALNYASRHMSWLHCMWGLGASLGPYIMSRALTGGAGWPVGYRIISMIQFALTVLLIVTLPLWGLGAHSAAGPGDRSEEKALSLPRLLGIPGVKAVMVAFFCYCALEQTAGLWAGSYLVLEKGIPPETAAAFSGLFYLGITAGRMLGGFLTLKLEDGQMVRLGQGVIALGLAAMLLPLGQAPSLLGLLLIGLGCAPIYPSVIHATPARFGADRSQAIIGVQMASAYIGNCLMPPLFGLVANRLTSALLPLYLLAILALMTLAHETLLKRTGT